MINAYKVLGLRNFATRREILIAYRNFSKKYHPDLNQGDKFYEEKFKEIQAAYVVLSDFGQRMELDTFLRKQIETGNVVDETSAATEPLNGKQTQETEMPPNEEINEQSSYPGKQHLKTTLYIFVTLCVTGITLFFLIGHKKGGSDFTTENKINQPTIQNDSIDKPSITKNDYAELKNHFSIYSTKEEVIKIQGEPSDSIRVSALKQDIWYYEMSSVTFEDNRVVEYANIGDNLHISYFNTNYNITPKSAFSIGSTRLDVIAVQGNPTTTMRIKPLDQEIWHYGESRIAFEKGKVNEYTNSERNLKVRSGNQKSPGHSSFNRLFTIGSTKDEVLYAQSNPTSATKIDALKK
ncbi:MAG: J domain-containing protein [Tannerella sp.]|jgi:curved DNA-binding protein CbpA|nr:J domain-containing protein [Tannerella sp.]